jgi:hypothetical protein
VSADLVDRLVQTPRLRKRLDDLITSRFAALGPLDPVQARLIAMNEQEMTELAAKAGAIWHAGSIARVIDQAGRHILIGLLGERHYKLALAAVQEQPAAALLPGIPQVIAEAVAKDGAACLAAWCARQPPALRGCLDLMRPAALPAPTHLAAGPRIIAKLLAQ